MSYNTCIDKFENEHVYTNPFRTLDYSGRFEHKYIAGSFHFFSGKYGNGENVKYYSMLKFDLIFPTSPPFVELYLAEFSTSVTRNDNNNIPVS